jgi:hypothetical protein
MIVFCVCVKSEPSVLSCNLCDGGWDRVGGGDVKVTKTTHTRTRLERLNGWSCDFFCRF